MQKLCTVLKNAVAVPVHGESTPYILPTIPDVVLTQLQDGVLHSMELVQKVITKIFALECIQISYFLLNSILKLFYVLSVNVLAMCFPLN